MLYYLDTNIVIYAVEGEPALQQRARNHMAALEAAGHRFGIGQLTWAESLVIPFRNGDGSLLVDYHRFLLATHLTTIALTAGTHHRAAMIRATYRYGLADSIHVATAVENCFDRFLTHDQALVNFSEIVVELLP